MGRMVNRRRLFAGVSALAGTVAGAGLPRDAQAYPGFATHFNAHTVPFMDSYYNGMIGIITALRDTQLGNIGRAMETAYELQRKGGTLYSNIVFGHFARYAGSRDLPGQPWILPQYVDMKEDDFAAMKEGDFLLTNMVDEQRKIAHDRGVYVVGVTNNYYKFSRTAAEGLVPDRMELATGEISDIVIDSQMPWYNGLVDAPQLPRFRICPSSGTVMHAVYWACTASLATLIATKGKASSTEPARRYLDMCLDRFVKIGYDRPKIDRVADKWADLVLAGARLHVYGNPHRITGDRTGNMFVSDAVGAASGSMIAQVYQVENVRPDDIVLIGAIGSSDARDIAVAREARQAGAYTVAFCPYTTDGDASGERLYKEVEAAFNTYCDESAGVIPVKGFDRGVAPLTGLCGNMVLWLLTAQWTDHMARRGEMPYYWQGFHENGGREYDRLVRPYFMKRGY